jgi:hypothetical protein
MKERIYLICYKNDYSRRGQIANIVGMKKLTNYTISLISNTNVYEICYHIIFEDGHEDYISIQNLNNINNDWHFVTLAELLMRGQPK